MKAIDTSAAESLDFGSRELILQPDWRRVALYAVAVSMDRVGDIPPAGDLLARETCIIDGKSL